VLAGNLPVVERENGEQVVYEVVRHTDKSGTDQDASQKIGLVTAANSSLRVRSSTRHQRSLHLPTSSIHSPEEPAVCSSTNRPSTTSRRRASPFADAHLSLSFVASRGSKSPDIASKPFGISAVSSSRGPEDRYE